MKRKKMLAGWMAEELDDDKWSLVIYEDAEGVGVVWLPDDIEGATLKERFHKFYRKTRSEAYWSRYDFAEGNYSSFKWRTCVDAVKENGLQIPEEVLEKRSLSEALHAL